MHPHKCKKDLFMQTGRRSFTKNKIYYSEDRFLNSKSELKDDQGNKHGVSNWYIHFKNPLYTILKNL